MQSGIKNLFNFSGFEHVFFEVSVSYAAHLALTAYHSDVCDSILRLQTATDFILLS